MLIWLILVNAVDVAIIFVFLIKLLIPNNRNSNDNAHTNNGINKLIKSTEVAGLTESGTVILIIMYETMQKRNILINAVNRKGTKRLTRYN